MVRLEINIEEYSDRRILIAAAGLLTALAEGQPSLAEYDRDGCGEPAAPTALVYADSNTAGAVQLDLTPTTLIQVEGETVVLKQEGTPWEPAPPAATIPLPAAPEVPLPPPTIVAPAAPPVAPVAPPVAPVAPPAGVELDSQGIPWDGRIHAAARTKCKDGTWKNRPGVDKTLLDQVVAELKGVQAIPAPPAPPAGEAAPANFAALVARISPHFVTVGAPPQPHQTLTADVVNNICAQQGLPQFGLLAGRPDLIPVIWENIKVLLP